MLNIVNIYNKITNNKIYKLFYKNLYILGLVTLLISSTYLRFYNLPYSEFQDDEKKTRIVLQENQSVIDFFAEQRKGPVQFLIAYIPHTYFENKGQPNEFLTRLPFTLINLSSVFVLYFLIKKLTNSHLAAFMSSSLFSFNGFIIGFSRIAQYQSLNLFFSFVSLYFFSNLLMHKRNQIRNTFFGSIFIILSILSHWDAVFYIVPLLYFYLPFLFSKSQKTIIKIKSLLTIFLVSLFTLIPYLLFYVYNLSTNNSDNVDYFLKRIGIEGSLLQRHYEIFSLYNPVLTLPLLILGLIIALIFIKKTHMYFLWFLVNFMSIKILMVTPKTHIYNYVVPACITSGISIYYLFNYLNNINFNKAIFNKISKLFSYFILLSYFAILSLLFVQSHQIFVDHKSEYPFDDKKILWYEHKELLDKEVITFGFPHFRNWKVINEYINSDCRYETNEDKSISQIYIRAKYGKNDDCYYIVVIKRPFVTQYKDVKYPGLKKSKIIYEFKNSDGSLLSRVYKIK